MSCICILHRDERCSSTREPVDDLYLFNTLCVSRMLVGVATVANKRHYCDARGPYPLIRSILEPVFCQAQLIHCAYESLRCQIGQSLYETQPITLCGVNVMSLWTIQNAMAIIMFASKYNILLVLLLGAVPQSHHLLANNKM